MLKVKLILILCFMNYMTLSQTDSTYCFTEGQVKKFLTTKVELKECLKINSIIEAEVYDLKKEKVALIEDNQSKSHKLSRSRRVSFYGIVGTIIFGALSIIR